MIARDPRLVRLIAGRYRELQGWGTVANAGFLLVFAAGVRTYGSNGLIVWTIALGVYVILCDTWLRVRIDRYYATRFGRVGVPAASSTRPGVDGGFITFFWVALLFDQQTAGWMATSVITAVLTVPFAWIVVRDWPFRAHWLLPVAVGVSCGLRFASVVTPSDLRALEGLACIAGALAIAAAGVLDHLLLTRALSAAPPRPVESEDPTYDPASRPRA